MKNKNPLLPPLPNPRVRPQGGVIQKILVDLNSAPQNTLGAERYAQTDHYPDHNPPPIMSSEIVKVPFQYRRIPERKNLKIPNTVENVQDTAQYRIILCYTFLLPMGLHLTSK